MDKDNLFSENSGKGSPSKLSEGGQEGLNPESLQKEFQELIEKKFGNKVQVFSMDTGFPFQEKVEDSDKKDSKTSFYTVVEDFNYKPRDIKNYLDQFVIGQEEAKVALSIAVCDHYNHLKVHVSKEKVNVHYQKQNILIMGPTGVGKTYLVRLISELIGVPFVKADATRFSEVGYMGANVDDIIRDLVQIAGGDLELASKGIVYVDEVDKLASRQDQRGRDVSGRGVQFGLLRLLENTDVDLNANHDIASQFKTFMSFQRKGKAEKEIVNTRDILFIFSGAFHGLETIVNARLNSQSIGVHSALLDKQSQESLKLVETRDLVDFGFEHEFIGRLPVRVVCSSLNQQDLEKILTDSQHSILKQYQQSFKYYDIELKFDQKAIRKIAEKAIGRSTGARGLSAVLEEILRPFKFHLPSTEIHHLSVTESLVDDPQKELSKILNI